MSYKIVWTERALNKIQEVIEYIGPDHKLTASNWAQCVYDRVDNLIEFPNIGTRVKAQSDDNLRELIVGSYSLFYEINHNERYIEILSLYRCSELDSFENIK